VVTNRCADACAEAFKTRLITNAFRFSGRLYWHTPLWAWPHPKAKWWIVFSNRPAAPVAWQPENDATPLLILGLADQRPLLVRLFSRLRRRQRQPVHRRSEGT
jgi:hypothetical protein